MFSTPISKPVTFGWILSTTDNFTHSILVESSILSHIRCCRLLSLVWSFACTCNAMLLSSINVQHLRDTFFCRVLCSCCVSLKVDSDQISGLVFSHYFSWLCNKILHKNSLLHILHVLSWLTNPDLNILVYVCNLFINILKNHTKCQCSSASQFSVLKPPSFFTSLKSRLKLMIYTLQEADRLELGS